MVLSACRRPAKVSLNPYRSLPDHRFWRKAIANVPSFAIDPLIDAPFRIAPQDKVATAGSCFAQNIARALQTSGFCYFVPESGPADLSDQERAARNYGVYSARYGNIYTTRQLLQLTGASSRSSMSGPARTDVMSIRSVRRSSRTVSTLRKLCGMTARVTSQRCGACSKSLTFSSSHSA
jgi:hypothetical protein